LAYIGGELNESPLAAETAWLFSQELNVVLADPENLLSRIKDVVWSQEGIGWNASILAYDFYYSKLREFGIKVILEGHGADEMYGGYPGMVSEFLFKKPIYFQAADTIRLLKMANLGANPEVGESRIESELKLISYFFRGYLSANLGRSRLQNKQKKPLHSDDAVLADAYQFQSIEQQDYSQFSRKSFKSVIYNHVFSKTLPQVLRVFDRASMANGIESRAPFLDYRLFELGMSLPDSQLLSAKYTKPLIREALTQYIPKHIRTQSIKRGFGAPLHSIFKTDATRKYLLTKEMRDLYANAEGINSKSLIKLLKSGPSDLSADQIRNIWQATTFAIWQSKFF
jgi:asparagine synthase (glutamine-hydrolysing)